MSESELGWTAGIFDGEGTVALNKSSKAGPRPPRRGFLWTSKVTMDNTDLETCEHFVKILGFGSITTVNMNGYHGHENAKPIHRVSVKPSEMKKALEKLLPYLVTKRKKAELLLEYLNLVEKYPGSPRNPMRTDVRDRRIEAIYWDMRLLNAKGKGGDERVRKEKAQPYSKQQFDADLADLKESIPIEEFEAHEEKEERINRHLATISRVYGTLSHKPSISQPIEDPKVFAEQMTKALGEEKEHKRQVRNRISRKWKAKNKDQVAEYNAQYYTEHKDELNRGESARRANARLKERIAADPVFAEKHRAYQREAMRRHRDKKRGKSEIPATPNYASA